MIQELFTELKDLFLLLSYDDSKLGTTRAISAISIGKSSKFDSKNCSCVQISHQENIQMTQIWFCGKIGIISWYTQRIFEIF